MKIDNFSYNYYSGANVSLEIFNLFTNRLLRIDSVGISYNVNYGSIPIYSYCSELYDAVLRGREMVQGTLVLNHTSARLITDFLNEAKAEKVGISFLNSAPFTININFGKNPPIILKDCVIISRGQTIQIDSSNILEEYNFVGKQMLQQSKDPLYSLEEIKKRKRRTAFKNKTIVASNEETNKTLVAGVKDQKEKTLLGPSKSEEKSAPVPSVPKIENKDLNVDNSKLNQRGIKAAPPPPAPPVSAETKEKTKSITPQSNAGIKNEQATIQASVPTAVSPLVWNENNKVKGREDTTEFNINSPFDPNLLRNKNNKEKTKKFLEGIFTDSSNKEVTENIKDMLTYMVKKERRGLENKGREPLANATELEREQAGLLWVATNRVKINDIVRKQTLYSDVSAEDQLNSVLKAKNWASYSGDYSNPDKYKGSYKDAKNSQIAATIDKFFNGDLPNEIFTNTNFVHANDNLKKVPSWSLDFNQRPNTGVPEGTSGYNPIYVGNAIFSYGYSNYYPTIENEYLQLYPEYYDNDKNYMQKRIYETPYDLSFSPGHPAYYKYNGSYKPDFRIEDQSEREEDVE